MVSCDQELNLTSNICWKSWHVMSQWYEWPLYHKSRLQLCGVLHWTVGSHRLVECFSMLVMTCWWSAVVAGRGLRRFMALWHWSTSFPQDLNLDLQQANTWNVTLEQKQTCVVLLQDGAWTNRTRDWSICAVAPFPRTEPKFQKSDKSHSLIHLDISPNHDTCQASLSRKRCWTAR